MIETILGISAFWNPPAACLLREGVLIATAGETDDFPQSSANPFPKNAIEHCLKVAQCPLPEVNSIAVYENPTARLHRHLSNHYYHGTFQSFRDFGGAPQMSQYQRLVQKSLKAINTHCHQPLHFIERHHAMAAASFHESSCDEAALLVIDDTGDNASTSLGVGKDHRIFLDQELLFPHSLELLNSAFAQYLGFDAKGSEADMRQLAAEGEARYADRIFEYVLDLKDDGSFTLNMDYLEPIVGKTTAKFETLFDGPPRKPESPITQREIDLAKSIQQATEDTILKIVRYQQKAANLRELCIAGTLLEREILQKRLLEQTNLKAIWSSSHKESIRGALGAALMVHGS